MATNLEVIQHLIEGHADVADQRLRTLVAMLGFDADAVYVASDQAAKCLVYKAAIQSLQKAPKGIKSITESGYQITYESGIDVVKALAFESGCSDLIAMYEEKKPVIRSKSNKW